MSDKKNRQKQAPPVATYRLESEIAELSQLNQPLRPKTWTEEYVATAADLDERLKELIKFAETFRRHVAQAGIHTRDMADDVLYVLQHAERLGIDHLNWRLRVQGSVTWHEAETVYLELRRAVQELVALNRGPLGKNAALLYEKLLSLPQHRAMTLREIEDWFTAGRILIGQSVITKEILPALKPYGLMNRKRIGYYISHSKNIYPPR